jgi:photosystem II stability/assembly factor-like uncharacterized protein
MMRRSGPAVVVAVLALLWCGQVQANWEVTYQFPGGLTTLGISHPAPHKAWAIGLNEATSSNQIYNTVDGGFTWSLQYSGMDLAIFLLDIDMVTENVGFIAGGKMIGFPSEGVGAFTLDGGATWNPIRQLYTLVMYQSVFALDTQHVWLTGMWSWGGTEGVQRSTNGGMTWAPSEIGDYVARYTYFINPMEGWLSCGIWPDEAEPTPTWVAGDQGGGSYVYKRFEHDPYPLKVPYPLPRRRANDYEAQIFHTTDGGATWELQWEDYGNFYLNDLYFIDDQVGFVAAEANLTSTIYKTTDGGVTWTRTNYPSENDHGLMDVEFVSSFEGWATGFGPGFLGQPESAILHTTDGGQTWIREPIEVLSGIMYVSFFDRHRGFTTGGNNLQISRILRYDDGFYGEGTPEPTDTPTPPPPTNTPGPPTDTPTATPVVTATEAPPTETPTPAGTEPATATPTATMTPTPTPGGGPTSTPQPGATDTPGVSPTPGELPTGCHLFLNAELFVAGDPFILDAVVVNEEAVVLDVYEYILLDVWGEYYFWPTWTQVPDSVHRVLDPHTSSEQEILNFTWPAGAGSAAGLRFIGALVDQEAMEIVGVYTEVEFGFM